jgi:predicted sulfurtransferase
MKIMILLVAVALAGCNSVHSNGAANKPAGPTPGHQTNDSVRRVTTTELAELIKQDRVVVVDVRNQDSYERAHIRGAKLIPFMEIGERHNELPRDKMIVTYCS